MNKYLKIFATIALSLAVVAAANNSSVWAGASTEGESAIIENAPLSIPRNPGPLLDEPTAITVTESGSYSLAGICKIDILYKSADVKNEVDAEVPVSISKDIPFGYDGDIYLPGCHVVHYKKGSIVREASSQDGSWEVCFAERPDIELTVYHYFDEPNIADEVWIKLETSHKDGLACAFAPYTGEYAPGSIDHPAFIPTGAAENLPPPNNAGTVLPPPPSALITKSGSYSGGGICMLEVLYKVPELTDDLHVADVLQEKHDLVDGYDRSGYAPFPDNEGLIYYPGCHVLHFEKGKVYKWVMGDNKGEWKICFAARPDKVNTIYRYLGDFVNQASSWEALPTTMQNGMACAPAQDTGVYVVTGK